MKVKSNEMGTCPMCNGNMLSYDSIEVEDDMLANYKWCCLNCGCEGEEWYKLDFVGHNIIADNGDNIEITEDMIESEEK